MADTVTIGPATLLCGDVLACLREMPDGSVHCVVTSPPYWGLRDYGTAGMIGLEPTLAEWLAKMVEVCREVRRVLRDDGTFWLNVGDAYCGSWGNYSPSGPGSGQRYKETERFDRKAWDDVNRRPPQSYPQNGLKPKDLLQMPARLSLALQDDGWWVRSDVIWAKKNCMPESVTDRPTSAHEHIYLLTKAARYYWDADGVREDGDPASEERYKYAFSGRPGLIMPDEKKQQIAPEGMREYKTGRNLRNVWTMATQPNSWAMCPDCKAWYPRRPDECPKCGYKGDKWGGHYASFPEELPRKCILAGTSERGCCPQCGKNWERVVEREIGERTGGHKGRGVGNANGMNDMSDMIPCRMNIKTLGWEPGCDCKAGDPVPCTVLDPFGGSHTTGLVALQLGRRYIGMELNPDYHRLGIVRIDREQAQGRLW